MSGHIKQLDGMRVNLTALPDKEWAELMVQSFAAEAHNATDEFTAAWYARECVRIARQFLMPPHR